MIGNSWKLWGHNQICSRMFCSLAVINFTNIIFDALFILIESLVSSLMLSCISSSNSQSICCYVRCPHPCINIWTHFLVRCPPWFWIVCCVPTYSYVRGPPLPPSIFEFSASAPPHCEHMKTFSCAVSPLILWYYVRCPHRFVWCPPLLSLNFLRRPLWTSENIFLCGVPPDSVVLCAVSQPQYSAVSPPQYKYL